MNKIIFLVPLLLLGLVTPSVMKHYTYGTVFTKYLNGTMTEKFDDGTIRSPPIGSPEYNKHNLPPTEQAIEGNNILPMIVTPKLPLLDDMEAPPGHGPIWNFVNESSSGTIIFTWEPIGGNWYHQGKHKFFSGSASDVFIEHINGKKKTLKGLWGYDYLNTGLYLCKANGEFTKDSPCFLKFTKIEPSYSELVDKNGDIIHLMRDGSGGGGGR